MIMVKLNQRPKTRTCIVACTGCWRLCGCRLLRFRHRYQPRISQQQNTNCSKQTTQRIRNVNSEQMRKYSPWHELTNNANENAFLWLAILDTAFAAGSRHWANMASERRHRTPTNRGAKMHRKLRERHYNRSRKPSSIVVRAIGVGLLKKIR